MQNFNNFEQNWFGHMHVLSYSQTEGWRILRYDSDNDDDDDDTYQQDLMSP